MGQLGCLLSSATTGSRSGLCSLSYTLHVLPDHHRPPYLTSTVLHFHPPRRRRRAGDWRIALHFCMSHAQPTLRQASLRHPDEEERGGMGNSQSDAFSTDSMGDAPAIGLDSADTTTTPSAQSSPRHVRFPERGYDSSVTSTSGTSSAIASLTSQSTLDNLSTRLDLSPNEKETRKGLLRESFFEPFKNDANRLESDSPEEMQKQDPLGTQIWKLYHKTKGQLPNSERLENLSWRMMSMNLRRRELERQRYRFVSILCKCVVLTLLCQDSRTSLCELKTRPAGSRSFENPPSRRTKSRTALHRTNL